MTNLICSSLVDAIRPHTRQLKALGNLIELAAAGIAEHPLDVDTLVVLGQEIARHALGIEAALIGDRHA